MLLRCKALVRNHTGAIILALVVGSLTAFPQLIVEHRMGLVFQGIHPQMSDDELCYTARAHETLDGHPTLGNVYFAEHKDDAGVQFWIPDAFLATVSTALFGDLHRGVVLWDFLLPFFASLLTYAILYTLTRDKLLSFASSAFLLPGLFFLQFNRAPNPQLFVVMLLSVFALLRALTTRRALWVALASVTGGSLFYIYPFYWTYWVVMVALAGTLSFLISRERFALKLYATVFGGALLLGIPYFLDTYVAMHSPYYRESLLRIGVIQTHIPSGLLVVAIAGITLLLMVWCFRNRFVALTQNAILLASATLAGALVMNQHLVTGMNFQFTVHYTMPALFMSIFTLAFCLVPLVNREVATTGRLPRALVRWGIALILVVTAVFQVAPQVVVLATPRVETVASQRYAPVLRWLDAHTKTDEVVYANPALSPYIPAYTRDNVFFSSWASVSYVSQKEIETRFIGAYYLDPTFTRDTIIRAEGDVFGAQGIGRYQHAESTNTLRKLFGLNPIEVSRYPDADIDRVLARASKVRRGTFQDALGGFRVEYLLWDTVADPQWRITQVPGLTKLYEANGIIVYARSPAR